MAKEKVVVNGATLLCDKGATGTLVVLPTRKCSAGSQKTGVVSDTAWPATVSIAGTCSILSGPCAAVFPSNWSPGSTKGKCEGTALLKSGDTLACSVGGSVSVTNPGQTKVDVE